MIFFCCKQMQVEKFYFSTYCTYIQYYIKMIFPHNDTTDITIIYVADDPFPASAQT